MFENVKCKDWWKAAGIRAVKTMAQTAVATIGTATLVTEIDWKMVGSATVLAGVLSILTSINGLPECNAQAALDAVDTEAEDAEDVIEVKENEVEDYE